MSGDQQKQGLATTVPIVIPHQCDLQQSLSCFRCLKVVPNHTFIIISYFFTFLLKLAAYFLF